jgi:glycosyltransferase involved in cell wall biosynthesis
MLRLSGQATVSWATFDAGWYLATHPDARAELGETEDATVLRFYLEHGQQRGHSPNIWFDEAWHMKAHPGAAAAVREGHAESGFDSYCRAGFRVRSPHWLFQEAAYRQRYTDLREDALAADGNVNGYDHYLKHGSREGRIGHMLFDPGVYHARLDADERASADTIGGYPHYLRSIRERRPEYATSHYFDPVWYLRRYPTVAEAIAGGKWLCALHHYLANDTPTEFDPIPEFSEAYYLDRYKDVAAAVEAKDRRNGYDHFLAKGISEQRASSAAVDLRYYRTTYPSVRSDLDGGHVRDAFVHYLTKGRADGLAAVPPVEDQVTERQAAALNRHRADNLLPGSARMVLDFSCAGMPAVSVILVLRDRFPLTLMTLGSLRANFAGDIELILIDVGSTDDTRRIAHFVRGASVLRFDTSLKPISVANAALNCASAETVLLMDSAVELAAEALAAALRRLQSDAGIGAVGGKLVRAHGRLEAAGNILWRDGTTLGYLRDGSPLAPEANFVRDVDFCSVAFLLLRADLLHQLEGFDDAFAEGGYAEVDLCLRIAAAGSRVVYDPAVLVNRLTQIGPAPGPGDAREALLRKHVNRLRFSHIADRRVEVFARSNDAGRRVLFIDDTIPLRRLGSGFVRSNDLIQVMASLGYRVTVYPMNDCRFGVATIFADMPDMVEVMHDRTHEDLAAFLAARQSYYDVIWVARTHNLDRVKPILERITGGGKPPRIVLDTEAVAALREAEHATLIGTTPIDVDTAIMGEFANAHFCQRIIAVNPQEAQKLCGLGFTDVMVIGHWREAQPTPRPFADRAGMLFLGAMHQPDSPNRDALAWLVREVLPLVERSLGWETRLTVAGYVDPAISLDAYGKHPRITLRGTVEDVAPLYDAHRIFVAPTRYAAGVPYKVHEAASYGLPVVASELLCRQLGWQNGREMISVDTADPAEFARRIVVLYRDPALWQTLRDNALERVRADNNRPQYEMAVRHVLEAL